jgi:inosine/xanthosine triphosphate pyrophosphatase family protein
LLATTNPAKAERLRWVFSDLGFDLDQLDPSIGPGPSETEESFRLNAELKAGYWSARCGGLAAASDGGLVIPALGPRWSALRTARAAGPYASDLDRARHLLALAADLRGDERTVYWIEALALADGGRVKKCWEAHGTKAVLLERFESGQLRPGFWAASLCYLPDRGITLAALDDQALVESDPTWSGLRAQVTADRESGQLNSDRSSRA